VAKRRKSSVVDGFSTLKAVRDRKVAEDGVPPDSAKDGQPAPREEASSKESLTGIGSTALPSKHRLTCYECEYTFVVSGVIRTTGCPKCHTQLDAKDYLIESDWTGDVKTIGAIRVATDGVLKRGSIFARDLVLEGSIEDASLRVCGRLELCPGAQFDVKTVNAQDLLVRAGGQFVFTRKLSFRNVDIAGELKCKLQVEELVTVRAGGHLRGNVSGARFAVEEGGGLTARLDIRGKE
jgi:cytoskeletal protein CcmA (bactofilin family)